ncbi:hypothetical protein ACTHPH_08645 [Paenibacillus pasadenensis]|uniref:hypothetical protein n=1 Tax=Paenibacillus pasadenensis TaxID=217090 RepID=UPI0004266655|nr:hypothetical protein [Paenibacillus pasadenensis]
MMMGLGLLSLAGMLTFMALAVVSAVRKTGKGRRDLLIAGGLFVLFIVMLAASPDPEDAGKRPAAGAVTADSPAVSPDAEPATAASASPTAEDVEAQEARLAAAKAEQEAADKKAAEEASAKAAEEKRQAAEEAKRKAAEEAAAKALEEKRLMSSVMNRFIDRMVKSGSSISPESSAYLEEHASWFPARTAEAKKAARAAVSASTTSRHLFKNVTPHQEKIVRLSGTAVQVEETETDFGTLAMIHILDEFGNSIMGVYLGSTGDLLSGDEITLYGAPTIAYSFDNVGGGTTNAILLAVSNFTL